MFSFVEFYFCILKQVEFNCLDFIFTEYLTELFTVH